MTLKETIEQVKSLIKTSSHKDYTYLEDWIKEGDWEDMTAKEMAKEWDELPAMEK